MPRIDILKLFIAHAAAADMSADDDAGEPSRPRHWRGRARQEECCWRELPR